MPFRIYTKHDTWGATGKGHGSLAWQAKPFIMNNRLHGSENTITFKKENADDTA
jgi:hypothetical protein